MKKGKKNKKLIITLLYYLIPIFSFLFFAYLSLLYIFFIIVILESLIMVFFPSLISNNVYFNLAFLKMFNIVKPKIKKIGWWYTYQEFFGDKVGNIINRIIGIGASIAFGYITYIFYIR